MKKKLITLLALARISDILSTYLCLSKIDVTYEGNFITSNILGKYGFTGMIVLNILALVIISLLYLKDIPKRFNWKLIIWLLIIAFSLISLWNMIIFFNY